MTIILSRLLLSLEKYYVYVKIMAKVPTLFNYNVIGDEGNHFDIAGNSRDLLTFSNKE